MRWQCTEPLSYRASSPEAGTIELKIYGAQADLGRLRQDGRGWSNRCTARQFEGHAVLDVQVDDLVTRYRTHGRRGP